jgi:hypothetical protein
MLGKLARPMPRGVVVFVLVLEDIAGGVPTFTFLPLSSPTPPPPSNPLAPTSTSRSPIEKSRSFSSSFPESSSSSVAKGFKFFRCCCSALSPFSLPVGVGSDAFCFECSASRAASCLRAREGGIFKGGGGGGGAEGGSRSEAEVELVATVVEGVEM